MALKIPELTDTAHNYKSKPRRSTTTTGCFPGCFGGFSPKVPHKKKVNSGGTGWKINSWLSWSRLREKSAGFHKVNRSKPIHAEKRVAPKSDFAATGDIPADDLQDKPQKKKHEPTREIISEVCKGMDRVSSPKNDTWQERLCRDPKRETIKTEVSLPESMKTRSKRIQNTVRLSNASSFPSSKRKKRAGDMGRRVQDQSGKSLSGSKRFDGNFDPVYGLSIIMVTLIIMLVWGKLCAILCTSAWLYFIPRLKKVRGSSPGVDTVEIDPIKMDSDKTYEEYKKKVVFEGFLERNHRYNLRNS